MPATIASTRTEGSDDYRPELRDLRPSWCQILQSHDFICLMSLTIDGASVTVPAGTTILKAAEKLGSHGSDHLLSRSLHSQRPLPHLRGRSRRRQAAAAGLLEPGQRRYESLAHASARVERSRRTILEMLDSAVDLSEAPEIQKLHRSSITPIATRFPDG